MNIQISRGIIHGRKKVLIYGPEGIGKSSFAAQFPKPLFIDTEGSTSNLDIDRFEEKPSSWSMLLNYINYVMQNPSVCETLVIDTLDWAERLCIEDVCSTHGKKGIEDFGYGNGYTYVAEEFGRFLNKLQELIDKNICHIVLTAHAQLKKFEQPDEMGSYDRYELKLGKKTTSQTAPLAKEWADMILFANYETFAVKADKDGKKFKGQGGQRVMFTSHHPCWDAKNRYGLPEKLSLDFTQIAHIINNSSAPVKQTEQTPPPVISSHSEPAPIEPPKPQPSPDIGFTDLSDFEEITPQIVIPEDIPKALQDLMRTNNVSEEEIRFVVANKGYFPENTPISNYPPDFINGCLIAAWDQVYAMIKENKTVPF